MVGKRSLCLAVLGLLLSAPPATAEEARLVWKVENPFRFYRRAENFERHARAYEAVLAETRGQVPPDLILRMEHRLNGVDCADRSTPDRCYETAPDKTRFAMQQAGWAARSIGEEDLCYDLRKLRYRAKCERVTAGRTFDEDYILPAGHTVRIGLPDDLKRKFGGGRCVWTWRPQADIGITEEMRTQRCSDDLVIERVPYDVDPSRSGVSVDVTLPDGSAVFEPDVHVTDLLVVGFGDSFASGEGNPDKPIRFSDWRTMRYASECGQALVQNTPKFITPRFGLVPKRFLPDDRLASGNIALCNSEGRGTFLRHGAVWLSPDCHRSQYSYQFRVALALALEDPHRAVTFVHLACTGAEVTAGLFQDKEAREGYETNNRARVQAQFRQMTDLLCISEKERTRKTYDLPFFSYGKTSIATRTVKMEWCPPQLRKRPIDLVMLSIGGNDVGFSSLAAYGIMESASDLGQIVEWAGGEIRFGPKVARVYLEVLDERIAAVKAALRDGFAVPPSRVVHTSYEPLQYDENNHPDEGAPDSFCGAIPQLGMDVHPGLRMSRERLKDVDSFVSLFLERLDCISGRRQHASCPAGLATGRGTGFRLVTEHQRAFMNRGVCARNPAHLEADAIEMTMPRRNGPAAFKPYLPSRFLPYAPRWRLFRTPNDAYLTANTHAECRDLMCPHLDDFLQVAFAALYSGAIHPTAEAHALIGDHALTHAREVIARRAAGKALDGEAEEEPDLPVRTLPEIGTEAEGESGMPRDLTPPPREDGQGGWRG